MTVQLTEDGAEARSIMRWAWQDPQQRVAEAMSVIRDMASVATGSALDEIQDAASMLSRLAGTLQEDSKSPATVGAQLAGPQTIGEQLELSAIHGHHIPGTQYTYRHGWIPLVGKHLNDPPAAVMAHMQKERAAEHKSIAQLREEALARGEDPKLVAMKFSDVPSAQGRRLTPGQEKLVRQHAEQIARAQRAAARAASPATPRGPGGSPTTQQESLKDSMANRYVVPVQTDSYGKALDARAAQEALTTRGIVTGGKFKYGIVPRSATPGDAKPDSAKEAADVFAAAVAKTVPTPAHQDAVAKGQALKVAPGTVGEQLKKEDPALLSLAAPGASQAALKAYIDARVAAEVARQVGEITKQQHEELQNKLSVMHRSQQRLIAFLRNQVKDQNEEVDRQDRVHLAAYTLFSAAGVGIAIAGIVTGIAPIAAAVVAAAAPLAQIINDYVRST